MSGEPPAEDPDAPPHAGPSFINRIVALSLEQRLLVALITVLLIGAGIRAWERLPVDAYPDLSPPMVSLIAQWPGHCVLIETIGGDRSG